MLNALEQSASTLTDSFYRSIVHTPALFVTMVVAVIAFSTFPVHFFTFSVSVTGTRIPDAALEVLQLLSTGDEGASVQKL